MEVIDPARLRRKRKQRRYSQRELGFLVRRTQTTIYKLETGQLKNISEDLAIAIAARLECDWEELFIAREVVVAPGMSSVINDERLESA